MKQKVYGENSHKHTFFDNPFERNCMAADKIVSLSFDDGWGSAIRNVHPLLQTHQLPATFYIISERLDDTTYPQYMNAEDLRTLVSSGCEISVHTRSHKHLTGLSDAEVWSEIVEGRADLERLGFHPQTFAYPFGDISPYVVKQVREAGFLGARTIIQGINNKHTNLHMLRTHGVHWDYPIEQIIGWIKDLVAGNDEWLILMFHQIEPIEILREKGWIYGTTPEVLEAVLSYLKQQNILTLTVEGAIHRLI